MRSVKVRRSRLRPRARRARGLGGRLLVRCDVSVSEDVDRAFAEAATSSVADGLVAAAGIGDEVAMPPRRSSCGARLSLEPRRLSRLPAVIRRSEAGGERSSTRRSWRWSELGGVLRTALPRAVSLPCRGRWHSTTQPRASESMSFARGQSTRRCSLARAELLASPSSWAPTFRLAGSARQRRLRAWLSTCSRRTRPSSPVASTR